MFSLEKKPLDAPQFHSAIHLLDVGADPYGDAVLCQFGQTTVLIDGAHPGSFKGQGDHDSIPAQLEELLQQPPPFRIDLVIISHAHQDHIGCLPRMVSEGVLLPRWALMIDPDLGWGRIAVDSVDTAVGRYSDKVVQLAAALREHPRAQPAERINLADFLSDAVTLEDRYRTMIQTLRENDTRVVRFGRDSLTEITNAFNNIGLEILGPSKAHLRRCAQLIAQSTQDALDRAADFFIVDAAADLETAYARLISPSSRDALDAASRLGAAVNLQSIVTSFKFRGKKHLFAGDMQFTDTDVSDESINASVEALRQVISEAAPFDSVKLSHHGSHNAFSEEILNELGGTALFGICAGERSTSHPSRDTLKVLKKNRDEITWVRTDRNRRSSFFFGSGDTDVVVAEGKVNDFRPNSVDEGAVPPVSAPAPKVAEAPPSRREEPAVEVVSDLDAIELIMRIPRASARVTFSGEFTLDIESRATASTTREQPRPAPKENDRPSQPPLPSSKRLDGLLFVTDRKRLADNIGQAECEGVLEDIRNAGAKLLEEIPVNIHDAAATVEKFWQQQSGFKGVILLGGYDVVPSQRFDCLPSDLRNRIDTEEDPDNFIVWSDDVYGKRDTDEMPDVPVSRIPDGQSARLVANAVRSTQPGQKSRGGVRNLARPFAEQIWTGLGGSEELLISAPTVPNDIRQEHFRVDQIYLMLHGHHNDTARFWGEAEGDYLEAFNVASIPRLNGSVIFTGCCWGALTVNKIASRYSPEQPIAQKTPGSSIAMSFLENGANAFVGCTGARYSPDVEPYNFFGGPMHAAFWKNLRSGQAPAQALLNAKAEYLEGMPHGRRGLGARAIEFKILWQYTCLGLGW